VTGNRAYEVALRVSQVLRRYEAACRNATRLRSVWLENLWSQMLHSVPEGKAPVAFETVVNLVVDVECLLGRLGSEEEAVVTLVALYGFSEEEASRILGVAQARVSRTYWVGIRRLHKLLVEGGYLPQSGYGEKTEREAQPET